MSDSPEATTDRPVTVSDQPYLEQAQRDWLAGGETPSIHRLINTLVLTEPFRLRRGEGSMGGQP